MDDEAEGFSSHRDSNSLTGGLPTINSVIDGIKICSVKAIYENNDYTKKTSSNPADILYDVLTNTRYGLGKYISLRQIDLISFYNYSVWCDEIVTYSQYDSQTGRTNELSEKRYEINLVVDTEIGAAELLNTICKATRSIIYWHNDKIRIVMDKPSIPRQLFGMGNIVKDSYQETYVGLRDVPNQVEARFLDEKNSYKQQHLSAFDASRASEPVISRTVQLYGVTKYSQAKRELVYALKKARSIHRFVSFAVGVDGVMCEVGDVIYFSHDTPQYGYSGRVSTVDGNNIFFDRELEVQSGVRYAIIFGVDDVLRYDFVAEITGFIDCLTVPENTAQ